MRTLLMASLLIISESILAATPNSTDLITIQKTEDGGYVQIKTPTIKFGFNLNGEETTSAIILTYIKSENKNYVNERSVVNADCERGYGKITAADTEGKILFKSDYVLGAEYTAANIAKVLCRAYSIKKERSGSLQKQIDEKVLATEKWKATINEFIETEALKADGIDYRKSKEKMELLDSYVRLLANDNTNSNKTSLWFLMEADRLVKLKYQPEKLK